MASIIQFSNNVHKKEIDKHTTIKMIISKAPAVRDAHKPPYSLSITLN